MKKLNNLMVKLYKIALMTFLLPSFAEAQQNKIVTKYENQKELTANSSITFKDGYTVSAGGEFRAYISTSPGIPVNPVVNPLMNAIVSYNVRVPGIIDPADPQNGVNQVNVEVQTLDHFGRPIESQSVKASPTFLDIIQISKYDKAGREAKKYLPFAYTTGLNSYSTKGNALQVYNYYSGTAKTPSIATNTSPEMETVFEDSPLNRVLEVSAPGASFSRASGHTVRTQELGGEGSMVKYTVGINSTTGMRKLLREGSAFYSGLEIMVTSTKNENNFSGLDGTTYEYKDKDGQLLMRRQYYIGPGGTEWLSTYYVYDDLGNLCFVLPPKAKPDESGAINKTVLDNLCYQYAYDQQQRMIAKKIPGKGWEYLVYNKLNQVVMTQDSVQRIKSPQQWSIMKYDGSGRSIITGIAAPISGSTAGLNYRSRMQDSVNVQTKQWEIRVSTGNGYSAKTYPRTWNTTLTLNYYDDYDFPGGNPYPSAGFSGMTKGMLTASKTNILGTSSMLWTIHYYDKEGQPAKLFRQHYKGGSLVPGNVDETTNTYNFSGTTLSSLRIHKVNGVEQLRSLTEYDYDHMGRKINTWQTINSNPKILLSKLEYDDLGNLYKKNLHSSNGGSSFLQTITYSYNERGWLKSASAPKLDLKFRFSDPTKGAAPQYNGNIAEMEYTGQSSGNKWFTYDYDGLSRLKKAAYSSGSLLNEELSYDKMGNIVQLKRGPAASTPLDYTYAYTDTSNVLVAMSGGSASRTFSYDGNGNMTYDGYRTAFINYNDLNLPDTVSRTTGGARYTYDASGVKIRSRQASVVRDYIDGIQYTQGTLDFMATEEGRAVRNPTTGLYKYEYNLKDHLGNVRVSFDQFNDTARVIQEDEYYAFGLNAPKHLSGDKNRYLYNGKELQDVLSDEFDYGARFYDPVIGRWHVIDPLAEQYQSINPYNYTDNNPVNNTDPNGMEIYYGAAAQAKFAQLKQQPYNRPKEDGKPKEKAQVAAEKVLNNNWLMELLAGREVRNAAKALDAFDAGGMQEYLNVSLGNAQDEIRFDFANGQYINPWVKAAKIANLVKIGPVDDDVMIFSAKIGEETVEGVTNFAVKNGKLFLDKLHLQGSEAGKVGRINLWKIAKDLGKQFNVNEVVIQGGTRTTGKYKGQVPTPFAIKVE